MDNHCRWVKAIFLEASSRVNQGVRNDILTPCVNNGSKANEFKKRESEIIDSTSHSTAITIN